MPKWPHSSNNTHFNSANGNAVLRKEVIGAAILIVAEELAPLAIIVMIMFLASTMEKRTVSHTYIHAKDF